jgi:predicted ABC-type transport system involved in lysophospholipase L1 biosynthesis ATPase subunit
LLSTVVYLAAAPTGNLDAKTGAGVLDLLAGRAVRRGSTSIAASRDTELAARRVSRP